jgi:hypothetical protein
LFLLLISSLLTYFILASFVHDYPNAPEGVLAACEDLRGALVDRFRDTPVSVLVASALHPQHKDMNFLAGPHNANWRQLTKDTIKIEFEWERDQYNVSFFFFPSSSPPPSSSFLSLISIRKN